MKILFILPWIPYPLDSGGNQAFFNMLDKIRNTNEVSLIVYPHNSAERNAATELQKIWNNVNIECYSDKKSSIPVNIELKSSDKRKCEFYGYIERSMSRKRNRILKKYQSQHIKNNDLGSTEQKNIGFTLGNFVKENSTLFRSTTDLNMGFLNFVHNYSRKGFDMIQIEFYEYLSLIYVLPEDTRKVFVHHELRFIRNENEASLYDYVTLDDHIKLQKQKDEELAMLSHYNDIIVLTEVDKKILSSYLHNTNIYVSPAITNATVNTENLQHTYAKDLIFLGGGSHFPNADGILWFAMEVYPILKERNFQNNIYVAGKWGEAIQNIVHEYAPEIKFLGFVDDLYKTLNGRITIVPIRIGSGMRMKIIDSVAAMSPMVTTSKGCEGLPFVDGEDCYIADDAQTFADRIVTITSNKDIQKQMTKNTSLKMKSVLNFEHLLNTRLNFYK